MIIWHRIDEPVEGITEIKVGDKKICVAVKGRDISACTTRCPHAGGAMASGYIDAMGNIVCPVHHYRFSLKNGRNSSGEGYFLKTYPVEVREDGVYVGIPSEYQ